MVERTEETEETGTTIDLTERSVRQRVEESRRVSDAEADDALFTMLESAEDNEFEMVDVDGLSQVKMIDFELPDIRGTVDYLAGDNGMIYCVALIGGTPWKRYKFRMPEIGDIAAITKMQRMLNQTGDGSDGDAERTILEEMVAVLSNAQVGATEPTKITSKISTYMAKRLFETIRLFM